MTVVRQGGEALYLDTSCVELLFLHFLLSHLSPQNRFGLFKFSVWLQWDRDVLGRFVVIKEQKEGGSSLQTVITGSL